MLEITSIKKGIVIDHIKQGVGMKRYEYMKLDEIKDNQVALILNANSPLLGKKDIIKIENKTDFDFSVIGAFDNNLTINVIEDEKVVKKIKPTIPEKIEGIFECKNPRCITTAEREIKQKFELVSETDRTYKCHYCETIRKF